MILHRLSDVQKSCGTGEPGSQKKKVETNTADLSAENSAEFVKNYADYYFTDEDFNINCFCWEFCRISFEIR